MSRLPRSLVTAALVALVASAAPSEASVLLLDARCVDVVQRTVRPASVWIEDGRIRALGAPDGRDLDLGDATPRTIDLEGAHLVPGLVDLRVYGDVQRSPGHRDSLGVDGARRLALAAGVVRVLDLFSSGDVNDAEGAAWFGAAPLMAARGGPAADFPGARPVDSPAMAQDVVERQAGGTAPLQAVYDGRHARSLDPETLEAMVTAAGDRPLVVQVTAWSDVRVALERGVRAFAQLPTGRVPDELRETIQRRGPELAWIPQVALGLDFAAWSRVDSLRNDPGLARVLPDTMREDYARVRIPQTRLGEADARARVLAETLALLDDAGVRLLAGSGAGAVGTAIGFSLVRELEWWVALGIDPWRALQAATVDAAPWLGEPVGFATGAPADFTVVAASPVDDPIALRDPTWVIRAGTIHDPDVLAAGVDHRIVEELPENPLPGGGRIPLIVIVGVGFTVLLLIRRAIKRAAARALAEDEAAD